MGIYAVARGEVVAEPATVTTDAGTATVMVVRDCGAAPGVADASSASDARGAPADGFTVDGGVEYEVSCRRLGWRAGCWPTCWSAIGWWWSAGIWTASPGQSGSPRAFGHLPSSDPGISPSPSRPANTPLPPRLV